jgi:hypothetical protein
VELRAAQVYLRLSFDVGRRAIQPFRLVERFNGIVRPPFR